MNPNVRDFARKNKRLIHGNVLEVGSRNFNGSIRDQLPISLGIDAQDGPGVDEVCDVCNLLVRFGAEHFDAVVSCDALEHIEHWKPALENMWGVLKPDGILFLTMASPRKGRHAYPDDYWRWPLSDFCKLFGDNKIVDCFEGGPSLGAVVIKTTALNLTIQPRAVP